MKMEMWGKLGKEKPDRDYKASLNSAAIMRITVEM
jgi:hypothetical protein